VEAPRNLVPVAAALASRLPFYAITEYRKDKDILRVSRLLNHSNISITQKYLRSLGVSRNLPPKKAALYFGTPAPERKPF
jgi:hypothetical protein